MFKIHILIQTKLLFLLYFRQNNLDKTRQGLNNNKVAIDFYNNKKKLHGRSRAFEEVRDRQRERGERAPVLHSTASTELQYRPACLIMDKRSETTIAASIVAFLFLSNEMGIPNITIR